MRRLLALAAATLTLLAAPAAASAAIVTNGDFETGNFSGWHEDYLEPDIGHWFVYTGTAAPISLLPILAPPEGTHAAIADQNEVSRQILYQDLAIPAGGSANQLSLLAYYVNQSPGFISPETLALNMPNEQYRIDLMKPSAPIDSVASGDILSNLLRTRPGDPDTLPPTTKVADLSAFAGQTVRLRFAVVATSHTLNAGVDAVVVKSNAFTIDKAKPKKNGTAILTLTVPNDGTVTVSGKGVKAKPASKSLAVPAGTVKLVVKPKGKTKSKLNATGKAKVKLQISYAPTGLSANTETVKLKLKKG